MEGVSPDRLSRFFLPLSFTTNPSPTAQRLFNFIPSDVGRRFSDLRSDFDIARLEAMASEVLETLNTQEQEMQTQTGHWYALRMRPYPTTENQIDG